MAQRMGFRFNPPKSSLTQTRFLQWLEMVWDLWSATLRMFPESVYRVERKLSFAVMPYLTSRGMWESLMGSPKHAVEMVPLGRLSQRLLMVEGNQALSVVDRECLVPILGRVRSLLRCWMAPGELTSSVLWRFQLPSVFVVMDAWVPVIGRTSGSWVLVGPGLACPHRGQGTVHGRDVPQGGFVSGECVHSLPDGQLGGAPVCQPSEFVQVPLLVVGVPRRFFARLFTGLWVCRISGQTRSPVRRVRWSVGHCRRL